MVYFKADIECFGNMREKTGWRYITIPADLASQIKADCKKSFRVRGKLDDLEITGMATIPMGGGDFIIALRSELRKKLKKEAGANVALFLEEDKDFKIDMPGELEICLLEEAHLMRNFLKMSKSYQNYYINWINQAKTEKTRTKRLVMTMTAMDKNLNFSQMMKLNKS